MPRKPATLRASELWLGLAEAAALIGKHRSWIRELVARGFVKQAKPGLYRADHVAQGALAFREDEQRNATKAAATSRLHDARAREIELRNAEREHRLIEMDECLAVTAEIVGIYRAHLNSLPARITRDLALRQQIQTEVDAILNAVASKFAERAEELRETGETTGP